MCQKIKMSRILVSVGINVMIKKKSGIYELF